MAFKKKVTFLKFCEIFTLHLSIIREKYFHFFHITFHSLAKRYDSIYSFKRGFVKKKVLYASIIFSPKKMFTKINYLSNKICTSVLIASSVTRLLSFQKHVQKRYCNQIPYFQGAKKKERNLV